MMEQEAADEPGRFDCRGVQRGPCRAAGCQCDGYNGGGAGYKCVICGHPPGRHQHLRIPVSGACANRRFDSPVVDRALGSAFPSSEPSLFVEDLEEWDITPTQFVDQVPSDERCIFPGCSRHKYKEQDRVHQYCGRRHAQLHRAMISASISPELRCKTQGCTNARYQRDDGAYFDYCSSYCRNNQQQGGSQSMQRKGKGQSCVSEEDQTTPIGEVEPERKDMKDVKTCRVCRKEFGAYFKNNTVCQSCGKVVCTDCCTQEVCDFCYKHLGIIIRCVEPQKSEGETKEHVTSLDNESTVAGISSNTATHIGEEEPERDDIAKVMTCPLCQNDFGGLLCTNNTLCQACGKVVCTDCCTQEAYVPYMKKTSKVCNSCYEQLKPEEGKGERAVAASTDSKSDASNVITSSQPNVGGNPPQQPSSKEGKGPESKQQTEGRHSSLTEGDRQHALGRKNQKEKTCMAKAKTCCLCQNVFRGFYFKNNKMCQACGKVVCTDCCTQEAYVPYMEKTSKVCNSCYEQLKPEEVKSEKVVAKEHAASTDSKSDTAFLSNKVKRNVFGVLKSEWEPDGSRSICPVCNKTDFVWGLSKEQRRCHCRVCGRVVCQACSSEEVYLQNYKWKERVCDECWNDTSLGLQRREQMREEGSQVKETGSQGQVRGPKAEEKVQQVPEKKEVQESGPQTSKRGPQHQDNNPQDVQEISPFCPKQPFFVELTSECLSCKSDFSLPKRYQCPGCGNWVCSKCSKNEALIKYSGKKERVCDVCHGKYLENVVFDKQPYFLPIGLDGAAKCLLWEKVFKPPNHVECRACGNIDDQQFQDDVFLEAINSLFTDDSEAGSLMDNYLEDHIDMEDTLLDRDFEKVAHKYLDSATASATTYSDAGRCQLCGRSKAEIYCCCACSIVVCSTCSMKNSCLDERVCKGCYVKSEVKRQTGGTIEPTNMGILLQVPEYSFTEEEVSVLIHPYFSGNFKLPDGYELASPVYCIQTNEDVKFLKDLSLKIHHYADLQTEEDCEDMIFVSASLTPEIGSSGPEYVFRKADVTKSLFEPGSSTGSINLNHFSLKAIGRWISRRIIGNHYSARLYRNIRSDPPWEDLFCVCLRQPLYIQRCNSKIWKRKEYGTNQEEMHMTSITGPMPTEKIELSVSTTEGWEVTFDRKPAEIPIEDIHTRIGNPDFPQMIAITVVCSEQSRTQTRTLDLILRGLHTEDRMINLLSSCRTSSLSSSTVQSQGRINSQSDSIFNQDFESDGSGRILSPSSSSLQYQCCNTSQSDDKNKAASDRNILVASHPSHRLRDRDYNWILLKLRPQSCKWMTIGQGLGFHPSELDTIEANHNSDTAKYLHSMVAAWLQWAPGDDRGSTNFATLDALVTAVDKAGLGVLAQDLAQQEPIIT